MRKNWCEFDKEVRKYIKKRDADRCIYCRNKGGLQIAHIFVSRAHGGKGSEKNGVLLCVKCHQLLDNPIGTSQNLKSKEINEFCKNYLISKENIKDIESLIKELKFDKTKNIKPLEIKEKEDYYKCKDCEFLIKNKYNNSTIPSYYCLKQKKIMNKNNKSCLKYKGKI